MDKMICVLTGGPMFDIQVNGKRYHFEMHPYCGPTLQSNEFLEAASLWAQQGQKVEDGLCVWHHPPKDILKHLGGRHWQIIGQEPPMRGK